MRCAVALSVILKGLRGNKNKIFGKTVVMRTYLGKDMECEPDRRFTLENRGKFWKGVLVGVLVTAFMGLVVVWVSVGIRMFGYQVIERQNADTATASSASIDMKKVQQKISTIEKIIKGNYLYDENGVDVENGIYHGMMDGLGDPYSVYYTADEYASLQEETNGTYCGIGALVSQSRDTGVCMVTRVFEGSPSYEAGLLPGDILYKVAGEEVTGMDLSLLVSTYIRGEAGTKVEVIVLRGDTRDEVSLSIERREIEVPTVEHKMMEDKIGYILVTQFDKVTADQYQSAVDDLTSQGMEKLIIDLRGNPGGMLTTAVSMLDYMIRDDRAVRNESLNDDTKGLLIYTADKNGKGEQYHCSDGHEVNVPTAVLMNGNSASASEAFAGAMRDYKKAILVGEQSFGKGIAQNLIPLQDGTAVKITTAHYYTPSGFDLHGKGLTPDVEVKLDRELATKAVVTLEEDNQVQAAVEALSDK